MRRLRCLGLGVGSFLQKDDRRFKILMAAQCLAYIIHFALLGRPTAVASLTMSLLRSVLSLYRPMLREAREVSVA